MSKEIRKFTSATANKELKMLNAELEYLLEDEKKKSFYTIIGGEKNPEIPEYDFEQRQKEICAVQEKIIKLKHAINQFNVSTCLEVCGNITIDAVLVKISMLSKAKCKYDSMRKAQKKERSGFSSLSNYIEYRMTNFCNDEVQVAYASISKELADMLTALDIVNNTVTFEVGV